MYRIIFCIIRKICRVISRFVSSELLISYSVTSPGSYSHRGLNRSYLRSFELPLVRLLQVLRRPPLAGMICALPFLLPFRRWSALRLLCYERAVAVGVLQRVFRPALRSVALYSVMRPFCL